MFFSFNNTSIWLYPQPIDFRKQLDGLIMLVSHHLKLNPASGQLFLFRNGFWLCYKRLEQGKLQFPPKVDQAMLLTAEQFSWLLSGLDFTKHEVLPGIKATNFY